MIADPARHTPRATVYERNLAIEERKAKAMEGLGCAVLILAGVLAGLVVAVWRMG